MPFSPLPQRTYMTLRIISWSVATNPAIKLSTKLYTKIFQEEQIHTTKGDNVTGKKVEEEDYYSHLS